MRSIAGVIATVSAPGPIRDPLDDSKFLREFEEINGLEDGAFELAEFFGRVLPRATANVYPLCIVSEPTEEELLTTLASTLDLVDDGDLFIMVLTGHGFTVPLPAPGQADLPWLNEDNRELFVAKDNYVSANALRDLFALKSPGLTILQIIDACRADGISELWAPKLPGALGRRIRRRRARGTNLQLHAEESEREDQPTRIKIAAAREWEDAQAYEKRGRYRGDLVQKLMATWKDDRPSYDDWLIETMKAVAGRGAQTPVVRSIGAAPGRVRQRPFELPGAPPEPK